MSAVHPKVRAVGVAGTISTVAAFVLDTLFPDMPDGVVAACVSLGLFYAGFSKQA